MGSGVCEAGTAGIRVFDDRGGGQFRVERGEFEREGQRGGSVVEVVVGEFLAVELSGCDD